MEVNGHASVLLESVLAYLAARPEGEIADFLSLLPNPLRARSLAPAGLPCTRYLARGALIAPSPEAGPAAALDQALPGLRWGQTYRAADFGAGFLDRYGWMELFGTRGHFESARVAGGFLLIGPETTYPDHHHVAEEIYIPLTGGTAWRRGGGGFVPRAAGEFVFHPSGIPHAMRTGAEPLLALYLWRGGDLAQRSVIAGRD